MEIQVPEEHLSIIESLVASGRFSSTEEAVLEGIRLLAGNARLRRDIQIGIDQAEQGNVHDHDTVFDQLKAMAIEAQASHG